MKKYLFKTNGGGVQSYIHWLKPRLKEFHRVLSPNGVFCLHLDQRSVHYAKVELDKIFGEKNLINQIIWFYKTGGASKKHFSKKHDVILIYGKSNKWTFNPKKEKTYTKSKSRKAGLQNYGKGDCEFFKDENGVYNLTYIKDVWEIPYINSQAKERLGYPTQKPLALLNRIIESFTNTGDMVFDGFCGCGTTLSSAQNLGRQWLGCDISNQAIKVIRKRMALEHNLKIKVIPTGSLSKDNILRLDPFEFERYVVSLIGQPNLKQRGDGGVDGYTYNHIPIQVKKSYKIGRPVLDSFYKHIEKRGAGIIIAHSFCSSLIEEKNRIENQKGWQIDLIETRDLIRDAS